MVVKKREGFRPFGPIVLERANKINIFSTIKMFFT